jgi:hypothetical protein
VPTAAQASRPGLKCLKNKRFPGVAGLLVFYFLRRLNVSLADPIHQIEIAVRKIPTASMSAMRESEGQQRVDTCR